MSTSEATSSPHQSRAATSAATLSVSATSAAVTMSYHCLRHIIDIKFPHTPAF